MSDFDPPQESVPPGLPMRPVHERRVAPPVVGVFNAVVA